MNNRKEASPSPVTVAILTLIILAGAYLRFSTLTESVVNAPVRGDAYSYFTYAVNMSEAGVYSRSTPLALGGTTIKPDADVVPVFPAFVAATLSNRWHELTEAGLEASIRPTLFMQTALSLAIIILAFLGGWLIAGEAAGLVGALLVALSPHLVNINIYLLTESLFTLLFTGGFCLMLYWFSGKGRRMPWIGLAAGLLLGIAALTRQSIQYLPFVMIPVALLMMHKSRKELALFLAGFVLVMGAWSLRNSTLPHEPGRFSPMITTIQHGSYPDFMYNGIPGSSGIPYRYDPELPAARTLHDTLAIIGKRALHAPLTYLRWYLVGKPATFLRWQALPIGVSDPRIETSGDIFIYPTTTTPYADSPVHVASYLLMYVLRLPLLLLAAAAAVLAWLPLGRRLWGPGTPLLQVTSLTMAYVIALHAVAAPFPRYAIPFFPLIYLLAAAMLCRLTALSRLLANRGKD